MSRRKTGLKIRICYVYEVDRVEGTSFSKVKTVFDSANGGTFDRNKFSGIFNAVVKKISRKYAAHTIIV